MTPQEHVAMYTPTYSWVELLLIGIILAAPVILCTLSAWDDWRQRRKRADLKGKRMPTPWGWC